MVKTDQSLSGQSSPGNALRHRPADGWVAREGGWRWDLNLNRKIKHRRDHPAREGSGKLYLPDAKNGLVDISCSLLTVLYSHS